MIEVRGLALYQLQTQGKVMQTQVIKAVGFLKSTNPKADIQYSIRQAARDVNPADLADLVPMLLEVEKIGRPDCTLTASQVFELLSRFGIELDRLLPVRAFLDQERGMVITMTGTGVDGLEGGEDSTIAEPGQIDGALTRQIQFCAVLELFPVPPEDITICLIGHMP